MNLKRIAALSVAFVTAAGALMQPVSTIAATKPYVALGADLDAGQRATVLQLLGVTEADLAGDTVVTVTNAEEHEYLDAYVASSVIGTNALSSCKVVVEPSGHGIYGCRPVADFGNGRAGRSYEGLLKDLRKGH